MLYFLIKNVKGLVHPKMTQPQGILGVYDFLLSEESNQSYIKKNVLAIPSVIIAVGGCFCETVQNMSPKVHAPIIKGASHGSVHE